MSLWLSEKGELKRTTSTEFKLSACGDKTNGEQRSQGARSVETVAA
jgi:hypothetical protein